MRTKPKKSLGQNFLFDKNICRKIIENCRLSDKDNVVEIGPGRGELTKLIVPKVKALLAIELDRELYAQLKEKFQSVENLIVLNKDILDFEFEQFSKIKAKIIGNIPYYITTPILEHLLKYRKLISVIYISVQKEFALRVVAKPGSKRYGSLSCFLQYYCKPRVLFYIKRTSFFPRPKVDSAFMELIIRQEKDLLANDERLFTIIRAAFNKRRKTLRNSLSGIVNGDVLEQFFSDKGINRNIRPEDLPLQEFIDLAKI